MDKLKVTEGIEEEPNIMEVKPEKKVDSKLTKEEEKIVKELNITIPPKIKDARTKAQLLEFWKAIFIAALTLVFFFFYFHKRLK